MSVKSRKSSKAIDRPFTKGVLAEAARLADTYQVILQLEEGEYLGRGLELPHVMADGKTADECVVATREAMKAAVAFLLERGETPPAAATEERRTEQVNIRLTAEEKIRLEGAARRQGFRGVSDFVRQASLSAVV